MKTQQIENLTTVTYNFTDGTKVVQPISKDVLFGYKGKKRSFNEILDIFQTTAYDKKATSFTLDGEVDQIEVDKEIYFTSTERKNAKRDYKEFKSKNPVEFFKQQSKFRNELMDKLRKQLRFNLTNITLLN